MPPKHSDGRRRNQKPDTQPSPPPPPPPPPPSSGRAKISCTEVGLVLLTLILPIFFHCLEMLATNPSYPTYCPSCLASWIFARHTDSIGTPIPPPEPEYLFSSPDVSAFLDSISKINSKEPTSELLWLRSAYGTAALEVLGVFSLFCRLSGRKDPEQFIDIIMEFLPDAKVSPIVYLFGRVFFRLDGISIVNSIAKAGEAIVICLYLVSYSTVYAGGPSLKKILKLIVIFNCSLSAELLFRFYYWEGMLVALVLPVMFVLHLSLNLENRTATEIQTQPEKTE